MASEGLKGMLALYDPIFDRRFNITKRILCYEGPVIEAIKMLNRVYGIEIKPKELIGFRLKLSESGDHIRVPLAASYEEGDPITNINHYEAILLMYALGKILGKDLVVPDSQQEELALEQKVVKDADVFGTWRADIVIYGNRRTPRVKKLLEEHGIKNSEYPVVIRHPGVVVDTEEHDGFRYVITDRSIVIKDFWPLLTGKSDYFNDGDRGLVEVGFPYKIGEGDRKLYNRFTTLWDLNVVNRSIEGGIHTTERPSYSKSDIGVHVIEVLQPQKEDLGDKLTSILHERAPKAP